MVMQVDLVKVQSSRRRYEYWRTHGVVLLIGGEPYQLVKGDELDHFTDRLIFEEKYPGREQVQVLDGVDQSLADEEHDCDLPDKGQLP